MSTKRAACRLLFLAVLVAAVAFVTSRGGDEPKLCDSARLNVRGVIREYAENPPCIIKARLRF